MNKKFPVKGLTMFLISLVCVTQIGVSPLLGQDDMEIITRENASQLTLISQLGHNPFIESIAFNPQAPQIASGHVDGEIQVSSLDGNDYQVIYSGNPTIRRLVFSPDGRHIFSSGASPYNRTAEKPLYNTVEVWNIQTHTQIAVLRGDRLKFAKSISVSPSGYFVAVASISGLFNVWMTEDAVTTLTADTDPTHYILLDEWWTRGDDCSSVAFDPTGNLFACGSTNGTITLREWQSFEEKASIVLRGHLQPIMELVFSPDGTLLASGDFQGTIRLWNMATETERFFYQTNLSRSNEAIPRIVFSPNGEIIATVNAQYYPLASTNTEPFIVRLLAADTGTEIATLNHELPVSDIAFSPDGTRFATASWDGSIRLWGVP